MILIKKDFSDFSLEGYTSVASLMAMVYASEILAYRVSDALETIGMKKDVFHQKRKALNAARRQATSLITNLETAFDSDFSDIVLKEGMEKAGTRDAEFHALAAEILKLVLIFMAKSEGMEYGKRMNIFKMLMNFQGGEGSKEIDINGLLSFFKYKE